MINTHVYTGNEAISPAATDCPGRRCRWTSEGMVFLCKRRRNLDVIEGETSIIDYMNRWAGKDCNYWQQTLTSNESPVPVNLGAQMAEWWRGECFFQWTLMSSLSGMLSSFRIVYAMCRFPICQDKHGRFDYRSDANHLSQYIYTAVQQYPSIHPYIPLIYW